MIASLSLTLVLCACASPPAAKTTPPVATATATAETTPTSDAPGLGMIIDGGPPTANIPDGAAIVPSWRSSIAFSNIVGRTGDQTVVLFTPTAQAIEGCRGANGGKLVLRLKSDHGRLVGEPQVGSSVDPTAQKCVLDALSSVRVDDSSNVGANAPVKAMGFTSLLTIEW